ncbi:MAG TPA: DUF1934 domain-containing protein [Clostridiales bacterium]|nr:DUF1934 domain-containing protein [Clostridiales bacterium]
MIKDVLVSVKGFELDEPGEVISVKAKGDYHCINGKHYIRYDETTDEPGKVTNNVIKISPSQIEIIKKGVVNTTMTFELSNITTAIYQVPYGNLLLEIDTYLMDIHISDELISVLLNYRLTCNNEFISSNQIEIKVTSER